MKNRKKKKDYTHKSVHLVIPEGLRSHLTDFLRRKSADGREAYASLLCGTHERPRMLRLLARHIILPEDECFKSRTAGRIEMNGETDHHILEMAEDESLAVVQVHTHLHKGPPVFSGIDDHSEKTRAQALGRYLDLTLVSCVFDEDGRHHSARLWKRSMHGKYRPVPVKLVSTVSDSLGKMNTHYDPRFDRQVLAFGAGFQARLDKVRIGVVGLGGLGAVIVEGLSRLGVRHFVLADSDHVEVSNLNRLTGAAYKLKCFPKFCF